MRRLVSSLFLFLVPLIQICIEVPLDDLVFFRSESGYLVGICCFSGILLEQGFLADLAVSGSFCAPHSDPSEVPGLSE